MKGHKSRKRLARRLAAFDAIPGTPGDRRGDKWIKTPPGKVVMIHRPGSNKK